ncbi:MAG: hypothetical protein IRZ16_02160 [Myxococcaceae bacterium]|nr:hypothetical protein [Myxococcaceae bacterium]
MIGDPEALPVFAAVTRPDGSVEHVRVGQAIRIGDRFELSFAPLSIGAPPPVRTKAAPLATDAHPEPSRPMPAGDDPVAGLEFLADRARRVLADPKKAKWHDEQRVLLQAIEAELARKRSTFAEAR